MMLEQTESLQKDALIQAQALLSENWTMMFRKADKFTLNEVKPDGIGAF